jgi:mono/diheme cytochrome c family protein
MCVFSLYGAADLFVGLIIRGSTACRRTEFARSLKMERAVVTRKGAAMNKMIVMCIFAVPPLLLVGLSFGQQRQPEEAREKALLNSFRGPELYTAYCASCHGKDGKGDGPAGKALKTSPPDLTGIAERNGGVFPFVLVQRIISGEEQSSMAHGTREMPVWGPLFSEVSWDQDLGRVRIYSLTKYLEEIQKKKNPR